MGIAHVNNVFSDKQALTVTAVSTNNLSVGFANLGDVNPVDLEVAVSADYTGGMSLQVQLMHSDSDGSYALKMSSEVFPLTALKVSTSPLFKVSLPHGMKKFVQLNYVIVGPLTGGGSITARLVDRVR